ncbi:MAG: hypothetical protein A2W22_03820 [Candidatus Levybacteria bacterium RBG_16_35_11]|nr:MAG: hypothetical protein A2W22_03820 [Candidatus Levybacteria bacterium RBG_16_35_11]
MLPSYHMIIVNLILSLLLLISVLFYRYIYPKKKINIFYLLILISLLPIVSIFRSGSYQSGDLNYHTMRTISYFNVLFTEYSLPRWTSEFYGGFGDPYAMFAYQLPYFFGSMIHLLGFSFLNSMKIVFALSFIASGIGMYLWAKEELKNRTFAFVSATFYLFAPYHLVDMHFRATIAESLSFVFPPLLLYLTKKFMDEGKLKYLFFLTLAFFLLILTHQVVAVSLLPILILYAVFLSYQKGKFRISNILNYLVFLIFALWLSAFYWFPILVESKYIQPSTVIFPSSFWQILYSPYRLGFLFQGHKGELSLIIGYTQILVVFLSLIFLFRKKLDGKIKNLLIFSLVIFFFLVFMILPVSSPVWFTVPFIKSFQFSIRLLVLVSLFTAILAGIVTKIVNKKTFTIILVGITIGYTMLNWGNRAMIKIDDKILEGIMNTPPSHATFAGVEASAPNWVDPSKIPFDAKHLEIIKGDALIKELKRTPYHHNYNLLVKNSTEFMEKTIYFPGWTLKVNGKVENINYKNKKFPGIITFKLPEGKYNIELSFEDTPDRTYSYHASLLGFLAFISYLIILQKIKIKRLRRNSPKR